MQGLLSTVLLLFLSQFQQHFELAVFAEWLFYMLTATTVFVYRRRHPEYARPYRVWGYPVLPAIFVVCAAAVLVSSYASNLEGLAAGNRAHPARPAGAVVGAAEVWRVAPGQPGPLTVRTAKSPIPHPVPNPSSSETYAESEN